MNNNNNTIQDNSRLNNFEPKSKLENIDGKDQNDSTYASDLDQNLSKEVKDFSHGINKNNSPYCISNPEETKAIEASDHESLTNKDFKTIENQIHDFLMTNNIKLNDSATDDVRDDQGVFDSIYKDLNDNVITNLKNNLCYKTLYKWQNLKVKVRVGEDHLKEDLKKLKRSTAYYIKTCKDKLSKDTLNTLFGGIGARINTHLKDSYNSAIGDKDLNHFEKTDMFDKIFESLSTQSFEMMTDSLAKNLKEIFIIHIRNWHAKVSEHKFVRLYYILLNMIEIDHNLKQFEVCNLIDPYINSDTVIEVFNEHDNKTLIYHKDVLSTICKEFNHKKINTLKLICMRIKQITMLLKIDIVALIKNDFKIRTQKYLNAEIHKEASYKINKEIKNRKRELITVIYDSSSENICRKGLLNRCIIYDPEKYRIEVNKDDMKIVYSDLEHYRKPHDDVGLKLIYNKNTKTYSSCNKFKIESLKCQNKAQFKETTSLCEKICGLKRIQLHRAKVNSSIKLKNELGLLKIEGGSTTAYDCKTERNSISVFHWGTQKEMLDEYMHLLKNTEELELNKWNEFLPNEINKYSDIQQIAAERLYGSYPQYYVSYLSHTRTPEDICTVLIDRSKTIMYLVENGLYKEKVEADYIHALLEYAIEAHCQDEISRFGDVLIGSQNGEKFDEDKIYLYPFEAIYRINSTYGRLQTLYRSEELTSNPAFIKLESMDSIIGYLKSEEIDECEILSLQSSEMNCWSRERKLILVSKIKDKMSKLFKILFPYLCYKYLVETEARIKQEKGERFEHYSIRSEEIMFKTYCIYMHYLSLCKLESFNPEHCLRVKLLCDCKSKSNNKFKSKQFCACIYEIQKKQVREIVTTLPPKIKRIRDHLDKICTYREQDKIYIVNLENREKVISELKGITDKELFRKNIKRALDSEIDLSFI